MNRSALSVLRRPWLRNCILAVAGVACGLTLAQTIDDTPPAVQNNVPPNFMFMIDTSGSMNNIVPGTPYSATATYFSGTCKTLIPEGAVVQLKIDNGVPYIRYNSTDYRHASVTATAMSSNAACFTTGTLPKYAAKLLAENGSGSGATRDALPGTSWLDADYTGHFLNWYFGNYTGAAAAGTLWFDRKRVTATYVVETRMEGAKRATAAAINSLPFQAAGAPRAAVRVGLSSYRSGGDGGKLDEAMGDFTTALKSTLLTDIAALTPSGATPLASTFADVARYLASGYTGNVTVKGSAVNIDTVLKLDGADNSSRNACLSGAPTCNSTSSAQPIGYWCQRSSLFAMTDGKPQNDRSFNRNTHIRDYDGDCTGTSASNCKWKPTQTLEVSGDPWSHYDRKSTRVYESEGSDYMDDVAKLMFDTDWRPDLRPASPGVKTSKNNISTYVIGFADPAVQNDPLLLDTATRGDGKFIAASDTTALIAAFRTVMADALAKDAAAAAVAVTNAQITSGSIGYASSYNSGSWYGDLDAYSLDTSTGLQSGAVKWSFRDRLNAQPYSSRKIVTHNGLSGLLSAGMPFDTDATRLANMQATTPGLTAEIVDYTRGVTTEEGVTLRDRNYFLGDIINAEPVVVNYSATLSTVFQAANDGMLHVIDGRIDAAVPTRGQELWAYVPRLVHSALIGRSNPVFVHRYLVDGTPAVNDVLTGSPATTTKLLVGGLGKGGAGYYALDITSATAPADEAAAALKVLWEFKPANMGYSFGTPLIVSTATGYKVVVASGYDTAALGGTDTRGRVWVLDPLTGTIEKTFQTPATVTGNVGLAHLARASGPANAVVKYLYGGDLLGNVWRVNLSDASGTDLVRVAVVTDPAGATQPITVLPVVQPVPTGTATQNFIYFGTGQYFSMNDVPGTGTPNAYATQRETIYGVIDDTSVATPSMPNIRGVNGATCPAGGGISNYVCQTASLAGSGNYVLTRHTLDPTAKRGFYVDIPVDSGRVNTQPALTSGGTLVFVVNKPSNVECDPGGSSFFFQVSSSNGGAILKAYGGTPEYFDGGFALAGALSSRPLIVITSSGPRAIFRLSDKTTQSRAINETAGNAPAFRRVYMRPLN